MSEEAQVGDGALWDHGRVLRTALWDTALLEPSLGGKPYRQPWEGGSGSWAGRTLGPRSLPAILKDQLFLRAVGPPGPAATQVVTIAYRLLCPGQAHPRDRPHIFPPRLILSSDHCENLLQAPRRAEARRALPATVKETSGVLRGYQRTE